MKLGIMQPYLFPYLGYFQLVGAVDRFVVYDDVQWIKRGWINRNRILLDGRPHYITLPVRKVSRPDRINQPEFAENFALEKDKVARRIERAYEGAPEFDRVMPLVAHCLARDESNVCAFVVHALRACCDYLGISTPFTLSSELAVDDGLRAQERILEINRVLRSDHYINPIGGRELYDATSFAQRGIQLSFLQTRPIEYDQFGAQHVPNLSIIDVMMFNPVERIAELLQAYDLV